MFRTLNGQFLLYVTPIFVICFVVLAGGYEWLSYSRSALELEHHLQKMAASHSIILAESVAERDPRMGGMLATIISDDNVKGVAVYDTNGAVLDQSGDVTVSKDDLQSRISINFSQESGFQQVGELVIVMSTDSLRRESEDRLAFLGLLGGVLLCASIIGGMYSNHRGVVRPIVRLLDAIKTTGSEPKYLPLERPVNNEIGDLIAAYNDMQRRVSQHEADLRVSREQFREMFENSAVSIWHQDMSAIHDALQHLREIGVTDLRSYLKRNPQLLWDLVSSVRVLRVNEATLLLFGARDETEFLNRIDTTFGPRTIDVFAEELLAIWDKARVFRAEAEYRRFDGSSLHAIVTFPIPRTMDGFRSVTVSMIGITERKYTEMRLHSALMEAEAANRAKSKFMASMSHNLRTALNTVLGSAQMLGTSQPALSKTQREGADAIVDAGQQLRDAMDEMSDLVRLELEDIVLTVGRENLGEIIAECIDIAREQGQQRNIEVIDDVTADAQSVYLLADRVRLKKALVHLLSNAIKYNKDSGRVTVTGTRLPVDISTPGTPVHYYRLSITDTGIGISESSFESVFGMFRQVELDNVTSRGGIGTGLTLTRLIIEQMDGRVGFDSTLDVGSTFWVDLVMAPEKDMPVSDAEDGADTGTDTDAT